MTARVRDVAVTRKNRNNSPKRWPFAGLSKIITKFFLTFTCISIKV